MVNQLSSVARQAFHIPRFFFSLKQKWIPIVNAFGLFVHSCSKLHRKAKEVRRWAKRRTRTERADGAVNFSRAASPCRSRLPRSLPGSERSCLLPGSLTGVCSPEVWPTCRPHFLPRIKHLQSQLLEYFRNLHCTHGPSQRLSSSELFPAHGCFVCWSAECLAAVSMAVLLHHTGYYVWVSRQALSFNNNTVMPLNLQYKSWRSLTAYCTAPLSARCFFLWLVSRLKGATGYLIITTVEPLFVTLPRLVQQDNLHTWSPL